LGVHAVYVRDVKPGVVELRLVCYDVLRKVRMSRRVDGGLLRGPVVLRRIRLRSSVTIALHRMSSSSASRALCRPPRTPSRFLGEQRWDRITTARVRLADAERYALQRSGVRTVLAGTLGGMMTWATVYRSRESAT
jgi:hypothetical protein